MYAIVATGGKQVKVATGDVVSVEKLDAAVGDAVKFDVIFIADDGEITVDADALAAATVTGEVVEHFKGEKAVIFKFKKRKGYKRLKGHRQDLTKVRITEVAAGDAPKKKAAAKPKAEKADEAVAEKPKKAAKPKAEKADEAVAEKPKKAAKPKAAVVEEKAPEKVEETAPEQVEEPVAESTDATETDES